MNFDIAYEQMFVWHGGAFSFHFVYCLLTCFLAILIALCIEVHLKSHLMCACLEAGNKCLLDANS